jgi:predicted negative regulator of RcsB-dependent stress response
MMVKQRITRKKIKQDEIRQGLDRIAQWVERNTRTVVMALIGIVVAALVVFGFRWFLASARAGSAEALARGQAVLEAQVVSPEQAQPDAPHAPSFTSDDERLDLALGAFREAADATFSQSREAARLYQAIALAEKDEIQPARELLAELVPGMEGDPTLGPLVAGLDAQLALREGAWAAAEQGFRTLLASEHGYPRGLAEIGLGRSLAGQGKTEEARSLFRNVERAEEGTVLAEIARVHREILD